MNLAPLFHELKDYCSGDLIDISRANAVVFGDLSLGSTGLAFSLQFLAEGD